MDRIKFNINFILEITIVLLLLFGCAFSEGNKTNNTSSGGNSGSGSGEVNWSYDVNVGLPSDTSVTWEESCDGPDCHWSISGKTTEESIVNPSDEFTYIIHGQPLGLINKNGTNYFNMTTDFQSGTVLVYYNGTFNYTFSFIAKPQIMNVTSPPTDGGMITIYGEYCSPYYDDQEMVIDFYFEGKVMNNTNCTYLSMTPPYSIACFMGNGSGYIDTYINMKYNDTVQTNSTVYVFSYQNPTIQNTTTIQYDVKGNVTIWGSNFANKDLQVLIDNKQCSPVYYQSSSMIICTYDGNIKENDQGVNVTVKSDQLSSAPYKAKISGGGGVNITTTGSIENSALSLFNLSFGFLNYSLFIILTLVYLIL